jgi:LacI family transcriptional regulator
MQKRVTAREVAEAAGVSRTTVSFVLNDVPGMRISEETRQRVLQVAQQLGYQPNISAQRLVTGQTRILAYVERQTPERAFADAFLPQVLRGVHDAASASNYEVLFAPIPLENGANRCARLLRGGHVDGIILSGPRSDDLELRKLLEDDAPLVLQGHWPGVSVASVDVDNTAAARMATEHVIDQGHTSIGMIVHAPLAYTAATARLLGYQEAVEAAGLSDSADCIALADFTPASGETAMEELLKCKVMPTGIFAGSDTVAIGAMRAAKRKGYRIPQDIAFIGFDDIPMAVYHDPPLTSIRLPAYGIGWAAADLLIRLMGGDDIRGRNILLKSELIVRDSCGALRRESTDR